MKECILTCSAGGRLICPGWSIVVSSWCEENCMYTFLPLQYSKVLDWGPTQQHYILTSHHTMLSYLLITQKNVHHLSKMGAIKSNPQEQKGIVRRQCHSMKSWSDSWRTWESNCTISLVWHKIETSCPPRRLQRINFLDLPHTWLYSWVIMHHIDSRWYVLHLQQGLKAQNL